MAFADLKNDCVFRERGSSRAYRSMQRGGDSGSSRRSSGSITKRLLLITTTALVGCGPAPDGPARPPAAPSASQSQAAPSPAAAGSTLAPPGSLGAPLVAIGAKQITLDGQLVGSGTAIDQLGRLMKINELYQDMKARRRAWESAHPGEPFSGIVYLGVAPSTSGLALSSVLQTIVFAGWSTTYVLVGDHYVETTLLVPAPLCEIAGEACAPDPLPDPGARVVHVQADKQGWFLRARRDSGLLERHEDPSPQSLERFRSALGLLRPSEKVAAVVLHVSSRGTFSELAPFLDASATFAQKSAVRGAVIVSSHDIDFVPPPLPSPEVAEVQRVVRAAFGTFRKCYEEALRKDPNAEGKAITQIVIAADGSVSTATTTVTGTLPPDVGTCMQKVFLGLSFPPDPRGQRTITYPIMFAPAG